MKVTRKLTDANTDEDSDNSGGKQRFDTCSFSMSVSSQNEYSANRQRERTFSDEPGHLHGYRSKFDEIMRKRWEESLSEIPQQDRIDLAALVVGERQQLAPEYSQEVYVYMRMQEEMQLKTKKSPSQRSISGEMRDKIVGKIVDLTTKKNYKQETTHLAINIFDCVLDSNHFKEMDESLLVKLTVVCVIMAAKVEQPLTPSIRMTIKCLPEKDRMKVEKPDVIDLEAKLLVLLDFDFNFLSPLTFVERYLRLLNIENTEKLGKIAKKVCLAAKCRSRLSKFEPSMIAAGAIVISLSIFQRSSKTPVLDVWNDEMERVCLYCRNDLVPIVTEMDHIYKSIMDNKERF